MAYNPSDVNVTSYLEPSKYFYYTPTGELSNIDVNTIPDQYKNDFWKVEYIPKNENYPYTYNIFKPSLGFSQWLSNYESPDLSRKYLNTNYDINTYLKDLDEWKRNYEPSEDVDNLYKVATKNVINYLKNNYNRNPNVPTIDTKYLKNKDYYNNLSSYKNAVDFFNYYYNHLKPYYNPNSPFAESLGYLPEDFNFSTKYQDPRKLALSIANAYVSALPAKHNEDANTLYWLRNNLRDISKIGMNYNDRIFYNKLGEQYFRNNPNSMKDFVERSVAMRPDFLKSLSNEFSRLYNIAVNSDKQHLYPANAMNYLRNDLVPFYSDIMGYLNALASISPRNMDYGRYFNDNYENLYRKYGTDISNLAQVLTDFRKNLENIGKYPEWARNNYNYIEQYPNLLKNNSYYNAYSDALNNLINRGGASTNITGVGIANYLNNISQGKGGLETLLNIIKKRKRRY